MHYKIAMVGQKGGVGKSTLARIIAVEATKGGLQAKIADMDTQQSTSVNWAARRAEKGGRATNPRRTVQVRRYRPERRGRF